MANFIQKAIKRPGALRKKLGVKEGKNIPKGKLSEEKKRLQKKAKNDKLSTGELRELRQINLANTLAKLRRRK